MKRVLVVDDEQSILMLLEYNLNQAGYDVVTAEDGKTAYKLIKKEKFDFIILDIMLPKMDGMDVCRRIRQEKIDTPILMLTAKDDEYDKIIGLELGADDYMTKPFSPREVIARIKAIGRRIPNESISDEESPKKAETKEFLSINNPTDFSENSNDVIKLGKLEIYPERYEVICEGQSVDVTPKEFELLLYMAVRKGRILSRDQLLNNIWNFDYAGETRIVDVHISHLREKIEADTKNPEYIKTVRGFGYKFEVPEG
ncbi:response regulator transcription factor [Facklamia miroungae]|uniref:Two-component system, OmpR family, alkaline phosphatase synthesis response regulator PhoP n=1 Tax=Facklamia miroungae TaxID=120956 RepID=A0A1G7SIH2_9LACT|nr:response regulator transcription factor [Facklamia miroungae]NKZ29662.1 response regulator transcription factor [Facklamia miroungae]SDG22030.1 two-component system, OmpR family, alkaline phosphatase synthesis response regulator PhoP [Facklamia miroungae]